MEEYTAQAPASATSRVAPEQVALAEMVAVTGHATPVAGEQLQPPVAQERLSVPDA
jgi:hypothetical protein